jgi:hypothetical protein
MKIGFMEQAELSHKGGCALAGSRTVRGRYPDNWHTVAQN